MRLLFLAVLLSGISVPLLEGQAPAPPDDWAVVQALQAGENRSMLRVRLREGSARGRLVSADASGLVLRTGSGAERRIERGDVRRIRLRPNGNAPIWGTLAGLGLAIPNARLTDGSGGQRATLAVVVVGAGWLIGSVVKNNKTRTIYQAP